MEIQVIRKGNNLVVSSRVIAEQLGKRHADVIKQIEKITDENVRSLIIGSEYNDKKGESRKEYLLTKDGFILYMFNIQGYNEFKMAYINKFNEMERELQLINKPSYEIDNPIERAKKWIQEEEIRQQQQKLLEQQKPLVEFATKINNTDACIDIGAFAKVLSDKGYKIGRNKLFATLREFKILMRDNRPYQKYIDSDYFKVKEYVVSTAYGDKIKTQTLITGKGQMWLTNKLK